MPLPNYTPERRREVAQHLSIDEQYIYQVLRQIKVVSPVLARRWNQYDPGATLQDLRPDDWQAIWPELATPQPAPSQGYDGPERRNADLEADGVDGLKLVDRRTAAKLAQVDGQSVVSVNKSV